MHSKIFLVMTVVMMFMAAQPVKAAEATLPTLTETQAIAIAKEALIKQCAKVKGCDFRASRHESEWIVIGSYIVGYSNKGEPQFTLGGWSAVHISFEGKVLRISPGR